jgi:hypothetical protein
MQLATLTDLGTVFSFVASCDSANDEGYEELIKIREALKNVGGEALARQIFQKKRSLHVVNEHFFGKFNDARASKVIFQSFLSVVEFFI